MDSGLSNTITDFVNELSGVEDQDTLKLIFDRTVDDLGFKCFAYHMVKVIGVGTHLPLAVTTYPGQWVDRYIEQDYVRLDPIIQAGFERTVPFSWDEVIIPDELISTQKKFFGEADDFKLRNGLSVPINGVGGEYALMSLVANGTPDEAHQTIQEHRHTIHLLTMYYHNHASSMLVGEAIKRFSPTLTKREKEALTWVANGKTTWETSEILSIAETTVLTHIENAKRKLNAPSRTQAVVKAIYLGLIQG